MRENPLGGKAGQLNQEVQAGAAAADRSQHHQRKKHPQACKEAEITVQTFYRRRKEYGVDQTKRLKELEKENGKLKL